MGKTFLVIASYALNVIANTTIGSHYGFDQGFEYFDNVKGIGSYYQKGFPHKPIISLFSHITHFNPKFTLWYRPAEDINTAAYRLLEQTINNPFFFFLNYMDAHDPYRPPRPFHKLYSVEKSMLFYKIRLFLQAFNNSLNKEQWAALLRSQYDGEIAYLDYHIGRLISFLKKHGLYKSSLIIVTSDHGELFNEHGFFNHETPLYKGVSDVPLMIKYPYSLKIGRTSKKVSLADLYHLILSICGLHHKAPSEVPSNKSADSIVLELYSKDYGKHRVLYYGKYKYMYYWKNRRDELYDLKNDPEEKNNIANAFPKVTSAMKKRLSAWENEHAPSNTDGFEEQNRHMPAEVEESLRALGYLQ
jgi:arylsulfatase A-like enzyme